MAETTDSNPITTQSSKVLLNIPRKQDSSVHTSCHSNIAPTFNSDGEPVVSHHHHQNGELTHVIDAESSSSDSEGEGSSEEESSEEEEEEEGEVSEEQELHNAGVEIDLNALGPSEVGVVPLVLLTEFVSCCVRDEYTAALILCKKVLEFEPGNSTALQFLPVLQERLKLDDELPTESSSDESDREEHTCDHTYSHHGCTT